MGLSFYEIGIIFLVALVVVGPKRLPEIARAIGRGVHLFRKSMQDLERAVKDTVSTETPAPTKPPLDHSTESETETHETHPEDAA